MLYHAGPSSLVFFAERLKIIVDSDLQIQNYKIEVQLKQKLHQLWTIALSLGKLQLSVFLKIVWVFCLERVVHALVIDFFTFFWCNNDRLFPTKYTAKYHIYNTKLEKGDHYYIQTRHKDLFSHNNLILRKL